MRPRRTPNDPPIGSSSLCKTDRKPRQHSAGNQQWNQTKGGERNPPETRRPYRRNSSAPQFTVFRPTNTPTRTSPYNNKINAPDLFASLSTNCNRGATLAPAHPQLRRSSSRFSTPERGESLKNVDYSRKLPTCSGIFPTPPTGPFVIADSAEPTILFHFLPIFFLGLFRFSVYFNAPPVSSVPPIFLLLVEKKNGKIGLGKYFPKLG